jgi:hypothetical protein
LASIIVHNGGALVTGAPRVGKTALERATIAEARRLCRNRRIVCCAQTHSACRLMPDSQTLAHVLRHPMYGNVAETLLILVWVAYFTHNYTNRSKAKAIA